MGEIKQTNFRIDQDSADRFREFCEREGYNQAQGFDHIMDVMALSNAKTAVPGRATEIDEFERHVKTLMNTYLSSIEYAQDTENRIRDEFKSKLESKDKTIVDLQEKLQKTSQEVTDANLAKSDMELLKIAAEEKMKLAEERKEAAEKEANDKAKINDMLNNKLAEAEAKVEDYPKLQSQNKALSGEVAKLEQLIKDNKKDAEMSQERAVAAEHKKFNQTLKSIENERNEEVSKLSSIISGLRSSNEFKDNQIEKLETKNDSLQDELSRSRAELAELKAINDMLQKQIQKLEQAEEARKEKEAEKK